jgi:molecular chaperone DnaK (HSP70)
MGRRFSEIKDQLEDFPYEVVEGNDDRAEIRLADGRVIPPELVAAQVLKKMRDTAEDYLGEGVSSAVITCPPTSTTRSARRPRTPAPLRASTCSASSTSRRPPPSRTV